MLKTAEHGQLSYLIQEPICFDTEKQYPAIIFLHGAGTRGTNITQLANNPFFTYAAAYTQGCMTVAPQCAADSWFDVFESLLDFCAFVAAHPQVDENRVYLIGASMGGYATWQAAMSRPELFAAIVPICGGGMYWNAPRLQNMPVWAFHGQEDPTVLVRESEILAERINACGGNAKLTVYPNTGHDAWTATYQDKAVFDWLLAQTKGSADATRTALDDMAQYG